MPPGSPPASGSVCQAPVEFAADGRQEIFFLLLIIEMVEDRADGRPEDLDSARRQRDAAAELRPYGHLGDEAHAESAILCRHIIARESELLGFGLEMRPHLGLELVTVTGLALDRDQLLVDEFAHRVLEHPDFVRKVEIQALGRSRRRVTHAILSL
jgi:hypothetical protein